MSGISGGGGRHAASHAKPGKLSTTKAKVTTTAAVTGAIAFTGGVAEAVHVRSGQLHQQAQAQAGGTSRSGSTAYSSSGDQSLAQLLQQRGAAGAVDRDLNRSNLAGAPDVVPTAPRLTMITSPTPTSLAPITTPGSANALAGVTSASGVPTTRPTDPSATPTDSGSPTPSSGPTSGPTSDPTSSPSSAPSSSASASSSASSKPSTKTTSASHPVGWDASPSEAKALAEQLVPVSQFACFDDIITRESSWNIHAVNPSSGAYGLPQALPGDKMGSIASDWRDDAVTQIKWAISYMDGRYGSPCAAWSFWQAHNWY